MARFSSASLLFSVTVTWNCRGSIRAATKDSIDSTSQVPPFGASSKTARISGCACTASISAPAPPNIEKVT